MSGMLVAVKSQTEWCPSLAASEAPRYLAFVQALESDISSGALKPGTRLLPQRDMAVRLGFSLGTISKAYAEAEARGLISGEVGRGTFVQRRQSSGAGSNQPPASMNLALNVPPPTGEDEVIAQALEDIVSDGALQPLLGYLPHQGLPQHRASMARWFAELGIKTDIDQLFITNGGQHGISIALGMTASAKDYVLTERFSYSGMIALSAMSGYRLHGVAGDMHGLLSDELDRAFTETGARVLFVTPTLQSPTGTVMPQSRREEIAEVIRRHDAYLIEDDVYAFLFAEPPRPISLLIPERSFYVTSLAKCVAPGLRIGAMTVPEKFRDRCINALRATGWMASPIMAEVASRLIHTGDLTRQVKLKRNEAAIRNAIADEVLADWLPVVSTTPGFHRWLPIPAGRTLIALVAQAAQAGITLAPPGALQQVDRGTLGVRICLGHPATADDLKKALLQLRRILETAEELSFV